MKAICDGLIEKSFSRPTEIDVDQESVTKHLKEGFDDEKAIQPTELDGKCFKIQDENKKFWTINVKIDKFNGLKKAELLPFCQDIQQKPPTSRYVASSLPTT